MNAILSVIVFGVLFTIAFAFAFHYWQQSNYERMIWWALAAYFFVGIGTAFSVRSYIGELVPGTSAPFLISITQVGTETRAADGFGLWIGYKSKYGQTISPIHRLVFIRLTNHQTIRSMIERYSVEVRNAQKSWVKLRHIDPGVGDIFSYDGTDNLSKVPVLFRLDETFDHTIANKTIHPNETVQGWSFFEYPEDLGMNQPVRLHIKDFGGAELSQIIDNPERSGFSQGATFTTTRFTDFSQSKQMYYSDARN